MSATQALQHEKTTSHHRNVINAKSNSDDKLWVLPSTGPDPWLAQEPGREIKRRDGVHCSLSQSERFIRFWIMGVKAAEKEDTEGLRFEDFLNSMDDIGAWTSKGRSNPWQDQNTAKEKWLSDVGTWKSKGEDPAPNPWQYPNTAKEKWLSEEKNDVSVSFSSSKSKSMDGPGGRLDEILKIETLPGFSFVESVAEKRSASVEKRRQMHLFFYMPTEEKVRKIVELIGDLR